MTTKISSDNIQSSTLNTLGGPKIQTITYPGDDTAADPAGGQTITLTGSGFEASASVVINTTAVGVVTVVSSTTITFTSPALSAGSYTLYVINPNGGTAIAVPGIQYSGTPTWSTAAGSLGNVYEAAAINNTLVATGDAPITYSLFSGTLPLTSTLNSSTGVLSGTADATASPTTYTFTIRATDAESQDTNRQFSLTINPDVVTWSSPANNTTYTSNVNQAISNVTMSATSAAGYGITYTANSLPTGLSISGANITGTPTVVANSSSLITATASTSNRSETRTFNWVVQLGTDPYFNLTTLLLNSEASANAWISDSSTNSFAITVNGDTRPAAFSPYETVYSNQFDGTGDYLTVPTNAALDFGTGDFTVELWWYPTSLATDQGFLGGGGGCYDFVWRTSTGFNLGRVNVAFDNTFAFTAVVNTWYHVAYSRSGTSLRVFVNGTQVGSTATNSISYGTNGTTAVIGGSTTADRLLTGYISNLRLVKGTALYTSNFIPSTTPLTAVSGTSLLTCQSNRFIDNSTNNFTLTRNGDVIVSNFGPFTETDLTTGSGYFDGTGDSLTTAGDTSLVLDGVFTIEFFMNLNSLSISGTISSNHGSFTSTAFAGIISHGSAANKISFWANNINPSASFVVSSTTLAIGQWYHVALVRNSGVIKLYLNGVEESSATTSATITLNGNGAFRIGQYWNGTLNGYMSNVRVVKGSAVYTANFTPPTSPLTAIANTSLLTLQSRFGESNNRFVDTSGINNIITRNGNATQGTFSPFSQTGWSGYFTGSSTSFISTPSTTILNQGQTYTVQCWIYPTVFQASSSAVRRMYIFIKGVIYAGLSIHSDGTLGWYGWPTPGGIIVNSAAGTITTNVWQHVALVVNPGNYIKLFKNGVEVGSSSYTAAGADGSAIQIGNGDTGASSTDGFIGYISNFKITQTALTAGQLDYSASPVISSPAGATLLVLQTNRFNDTSANNLAITVPAAPSIQSFSPFAPAIITPTSYSGYFDGNGDYLTFNASTVCNFGTGNFTISLWVFLINTVASAVNILDARDSASAVPFSIGIDADEKPYLYDGTSILTASDAISVNAWNHLSFVRSSGTLNIYINAVSKLSTSMTVNISSAGTAARIGANLSNSNYFPGYISNLLIEKGTASPPVSIPTSPYAVNANTSLLTLQSNRFIDNSVNNLTITAIGDARATQFNPFGNTSVTGENAAYSIANVGGSMYFDGTGDSLTTNYSINWSTFGSYTLECYVYYPTVAAVNMVFASTGGTGYTNFYIYGSSGAYPNSIAIGIQGTNELRSANNVLTAGQWHHVAYTYNGTTTVIYLNGVSVASGTTAVYSNNSGNLVVANGLSNNYLAGYVSNFRLIRGTAFYTSAFTPPAAPLNSVGATLLLNGTNSGIIDYTSKNNLETAGNAQLSYSVKKFGNASMSFDGTGDWLIIPNSQNFVFGSGNWTIELWVRPGATGRQGFVALENSSGTNVPWELGINNANSFRVLVQTSGGQYIVDGSTSVSTNTWYHVAAVRNGSTVTLYVNGTSEGTPANVSTNALVSETAPVYVGTYNYGFPLTGYIDDLRITKGYARYTSNFTPPTSAFITY